jgi:hypothetical protein
MERSMKTRLLVRIPVMWIAGGCSTVYQVEADHPDPWIAGAQNDLLNENATVTFVGGGTGQGRISGLSADSLSMRRKSDGELIATPLARVLFICPSRNRTAVAGGILGGALLGAAIGASSAYPEGGAEVAAVKVCTVRR